MKLILLQDVLAPYRVDLFNRLAEAEGLDFKALFLFEHKQDQQWQFGELRKAIRFPYTLLHPVSFRLRNRRYHLGWTLWRALATEKPDSIITLEFSINLLVCVLYARWRRIPVLNWWAGTPETEVDASWAKRFFRRSIARRVNHFLAYSQGARAYLESLGVDRTVITVVGNATIDVAAFRTRVDALRESTPPPPRPDGTIRALAVGALTPRKNHSALIRALSVLSAADRARFLLVIAGEGPLRGMLEREAATLGVRIACLGHVEPDALAAQYASADLFIHPTLRDHWSQAANEAMASGLPVLLSTRDHAKELIRDGENGFLFDPTDAQALTDLLRDFLKDPSRFRRAGEAGYRAILHQEAQFAQRSILSALRAAEAEAQ